MRIPEFLSPCGGTGTSSKLNYLLFLPFFLLVFNGLSLSCTHTLLSLFFTHLLAKGWGRALRGEGDVDKGGGRE